MTTDDGTLDSAPSGGMGERCPFCGASVHAGATVCGVCEADKQNAPPAWVRDLMFLTFPLVVLGALAGAAAGGFLAYYLRGGMLIGVVALAGFLGIGGVFMHLMSRLVETRGGTIWIRDGAIRRVGST